MNVPFKTQQIMWSQFAAGYEQHQGPDKRQCYVTGLVHGHRLATTRPTLAPTHVGMRVSYSSLLGHAASVSSDPSAAKALRKLQEHLQELGRRYYAGDVKVVDEFLQLYCVAPNERADAIFDQSHPDPETTPAAEVMFSIPIDLRARLIEANDYSQFANDAAGPLPLAVLSDLRQLCDHMSTAPRAASISEPKEGVLESEPGAKNEQHVGQVTARRPRP